MEAPIIAGALPMPFPKLGSLRPTRAGQVAGHSERRDHARRVVIVEVD